MQLTNTTPAVANLVVTEVPGEMLRIGMLTAKVTFRFGPDGTTDLETQSPVPLFAKDEETDLGILPSDGELRRGEKFEVILLGNAHPPRPPSGTTRVALSVGSERRELMVFGDRVWVGTPASASISAPRPFDKMPLVYERAFGGKVAVAIDRDSFIDLQHAFNPRGKGYDADPQARQICQRLSAPKGFPTLPSGPRPLPNIESPRTCIARWTDSPLPVGWATTPRDTAIAYMGQVEEESARLAAMKGVRPAVEQRMAEVEENPDTDRWLYRAHPDWVIDRPQPAAVVVMENLLPGCPLLRFHLPQFRVVADYTLGARQGQRDLIPQVLVLLPERRQLYLVFRLPFTFDPQDAAERAFRLRLEPGWYAG